MLLLCVLAVLAVTLARAQVGDKSLRVVTADAPPKIDGVLDDASWAAAPAFDDFTQVEPVEGAPPSQRTLVRLLFDKDNLYVAVRCFDASPGQIRAVQLQRDSSMVSDDHVELVIDPFDDGRNGYFFQLSAGGAKADGLVESGRREPRREWDGLWFGRVTRDAEGWVAEFAIPVKTISFNPDAPAWGLNVQRTIRRSQEIVRWATPRANSAVTNLAEAGRVEGLDGLDRGLGLTLKPYVSARLDTDRGGLEVRPGLDAFYKLTSSTTLAITTNTDFAEAEVDERRVNLTRFPLFFPEKRAFFLQDNTVFNFGGIMQSPLPFYSRRIGLVRGQQKDILAGIRVTGREDGVNFGLLNVQMYDDRDLGSKNLTVGRVSANVLDESQVGLILTHGDPGSTGENTLVGGDFTLRDSQFMGDQVLEAYGWAMGTFSERGPASATAGSGLEGNDAAFGGRISYPNDVWAWSLFAARFGEDFNPALGFVERPGTYEINPFVRRRWRTDGFTRRLDVRFDQDIFLNLDGELSTQDGGLPSVEIETEGGDRFFIEHEFNREVLDDPFEIADGVVIPVGDYTFHRLVTSAEFAASRELAPRLRFRAGEFYDGSRTDYVGELDWRPGANFFGQVSYQHNEIDLPEGRFIVRILTARANVLFSPTLSWSNTVQYDNVSDNLGVNSRVRWEFDPGQEVFVVFNQGYDVEDGHRFKSNTGSLTVKLGLTFRF